MKNIVPSKSLEWTNFILGACLACCALFFKDLPAAAWNAVIVGVLVASFSAVALSRYAAWVEWTNLSLGCWAILAPFILKFGSAAAPIWVHVTVGLCVALVAAIQLIASKKNATGSTKS